MPQGLGFEASKGQAIPSEFSLCLIPEDQDISSQLLLQSYAWLPTGRLSATMTIDSNSLDHQPKEMFFFP